MPEENESGGEGFQAITTQEQLDRLIGERINRVKSGFADYDDLKAKAAKFDQAEKANQTELERAQERIKQLESDNAGLSRNALAAKVALEEGVIPEVLRGDTEDEMRASAKRVIEWRDGGKKQPPTARALASGAGGEPKTGEKGRAAAALRSMRNG